MDSGELNAKQTEDRKDDYGNEELEWPDEKEPCFRVVDQEDGEGIQDGQGTPCKQRNLGIQEIDGDCRSNDLVEVSQISAQQQRQCLYLTNVCADDGRFGDQPQENIQPSWEVMTMHLCKCHAGYGSKLRGQHLIPESDLTWLHNCEPSDSAHLEIYRNDTRE